MRKLFLASFLTFAVVFSRAEAAPPAHVVVDLWPGVAPGEKGNIPEEKFEPVRPNEKPPIQRLGNVTKPSITIMKPDPATDTGTAVIVAPGGGYTILAWEHEGTMVGEWLNKIGVTAIVLKYRVPRRPDAAKDAPPLWAYQDAQRAVGIVRSKAKEWGIKPNRIGMLGFSAGGHLTAWTANNNQKRVYDAVDQADDVSCRPDFTVLIYPGGMTDKEGKLKGEFSVTKDTPPSFLSVSFDDDGPALSSLAYAKALKDNKVNAELHVFSQGGHGYGMKKSDQPHASWHLRCGEWMKAQGYLNR